MPGDRLVITAPAQRDLAGLWRYYYRQGVPEVGDRLVELIHSRALMLLEQPEAGRQRPELGSECRSFVVDPYLIVYRAIPGGVAVLRIPHTAQDVDRIAEEGGFEQAG